MEGGYERHYMKITNNDQEYGLALVNIEQHTLG